ncbi:hypothetical protein NLI96_g2265 [Meripilus lineatus]|uniref:RlpA-like protein double-psi beta-barrel domain-containing protein n=1 Tax=Meripilus lineatus TaxID=2056292 RepID=A0AAD5VAI3_9APHY|nr:hypothetical protein NLI96_g2265 [Physisporinus lineatus]
MARFSAIFVALATVLAVSASPVPSGTELTARAGSGRATWFNVGLGACGDTNVDSDSILALSGSIYSASDCGKSVSITNPATGKSASGVVKDMCPGCGANDIDLSPSLFQQLGELDTGVLNVDWSFS